MINWLLMITIVLLFNKNILLVTAMKNTKRTQQHQVEVIQPFQKVIYTNKISTIKIIHMLHQDKATIKEETSTSKIAIKLIMEVLLQAFKYQVQTKSNTIINHNIRTIIMMELQYIIKMSTFMKIIHLMEVSKIKIFRLLERKFSSKNLRLDSHQIGTAN